MVAYWLGFRRNQRKSMSVTEELHSSLFNFQRNSQMKERKNCTISLIVKYYLLSRKNGQEDLRHDINSTRQLK